MRRDRLYAEGSYTVEAAFLIPLILGIFFAWIFLIFYLHDQVIVRGLLEEEAVSQKRVWEKRETGEKWQAVRKGKWKDENNGLIQGSIQENIQSFLWVVQADSVQKKKGPLRTKYVFRGKAYWNIPIVNQFLGDFSCKVTAQTGNIRPVDLLRTGLHRQEEQEDQESDLRRQAESGNVQIE